VNHNGMKSSNIGKWIVGEHTIKALSTMRCLSKIHSLMF
jgi:hypothetical protein